MDTIFALSTAPGKSGVAVIRLSGSASKGALHALGVVPPAPRVATLAALKNPDDSLIDKALIIYFPAPHSFTGEDIVEFHIHGSRAVIQQLLQLLSALPGLRQAEPGEFARRAFLNGKMDLTSAEGLADLIDAETEAQKKQALTIMQGAAAEFYETLRATLLHALACLEAYIDFPDEDIPPQVTSEINEEVLKVIKLITHQLHDNRSGEIIRDGVRMVILGPPNVGKSSLMNALAGRDVAIVSEIAGTTRDVIEVHLDIAGSLVILSDTAGIREHSDVIEQEGIARSLDRARRADIKIVMMDSDTHQNPEFLELVDAKTILLMNKSDLPLAFPIPLVSGQTPILISVRSGSGLDTLMRAIRQRIQIFEAPEASFITRSRHRVHLNHALEHLQHYGVINGSGIELACEELRRATVEIGKITGKITVDELLGHIFSRFCIGK